MKQLSNISDQKTLTDLKRHALHSVSITFTHPTSNNNMTFNTDLPHDLVILRNILSANE